MTSLYTEITIDAPKEKIWSALADLEDVQNFSPGVAKAYYTSEKRDGLGSTRICDLFPMGKVSEEVIEFEQNSLITLAVEPLEKMPPMKDFRGSFELKESPTGVLVSMTLSYGMKLGPIGWLMNQMMVKKQFRKVLPMVLEGLKHHVETGENYVATDRKWVKAS
jgi:carbon monoxide dehydrogenase subunit G